MDGAAGGGFRHRAGGGAPGLYCRTAACQNRRPTLPRDPMAPTSLPPVEPIPFFLPGPAYVPEDARQAMTRPVAGHRSPSFRAVYERVATHLPPVFRTRGECFLATASSTFVMEAAIVSTVERDVLNLVNGAFSERWNEICRTLGRAADRLEVPWGAPSTRTSSARPCGASATRP